MKLNHQKEMLYSFLKHPGPYTVQMRQVPCKIVAFGFWAVYKQNIVEPIRDAFDSGFRIPDSRFKIRDSIGHFGIGNLESGINFIFDFFQPPDVQCK